MRLPQRFAALGGATAAGMVVVGIAVAAPARPAPEPPPSTAQAQANATNAAASLIAARPAALFAGSHDAFVRRDVRSAGGLSYVVYDRTYDGLPVIGGDLVVATDAAGTVKTTSVAQQQTLGDLDVHGAKLSAAQAGAVARGQVRGPKSLPGGKLVVVADGSGRLAYESNVEGTDEHGEPSSLSVYVDAVDGRVLRTVQHVAAGTGTGKWNGPAPLPLNTAKTAGGYAMADPGTPNLDCRNYSSDTVLTGPDDSWGNGNGTNIETGCADALFVAQTEKKMLADWVGRDGFTGDGGAWKIRVGLDDENAYYYSSRPAYVNLGHNPSGEWVGSLDILGHEMGHGVDDYSGSGGFSGGGTQEFIADTFGTATEFYANEPSQYDPPDYAIGEEVNLVGTGALRYMYDPSKAGDPSCYSSSIPNAEVHKAAGPGDHWFYLLAEGSAPVDGQPSSSTCDGSAVSGIGIRKAINIMHGALQLKTSGSSYLRYRTWTLQAAKNLYPGSCTEFNAVKAAWNAVSVPAQSGDPTCTDTTTPPTTTPPTTTTTPPGGCPAGQLLQNPGFESGQVAWSDPDTTIGQWGSQAPARSGSYDSWLGGWGSAHTDTITQQVTIPAGCRASLTFWLRVWTAETENVAYDKLVVSAGPATLATYSNLDRNSAYVQKTLDLSSYAGQTITLKFAGTEDQSLQTSFAVDDTAFTVG
ncbi:M4 family metallopeptidase [Amycolatopsis australiensis]|uniref:Zn-dependent metalloprotease n=1 Tax=Amycolatopsis australiensis TaxID=546364 RepID=A0A1K1RHX6_9PSEU|nr:M4 family metallopeptidase [Amycolatopsis australiensis]SFW71637.1 Zn-dependent metalloprotease [Amycolatopsis australiensis]